MNHSTLLSSSSNKKLTSSSSAAVMPAIPKSPVAHATKELIVGQDEANFVLENQQRRLAETRAELTQRIAEETFNSQQKLDELAGEENAIKEKLSSLGGHISHLHQQLETLVDGDENNKSSSSLAIYRQMQEMEREMADLAVISLELETLANNLRTHSIHDGSLKRNALELVEQSREQLFRDSQALAAVENTIILNSANSSAPRSQSRNRTNISSRAVSPTRHDTGRSSTTSKNNAADSVMNSPPRRNSVQRLNNSANIVAINNPIIPSPKSRDALSAYEIEEDVAVAQNRTSNSTSSSIDPAIQALNSAIVNSDVVGLQTIIRHNPRALHPRSLLLACTQRKPNPEIIDALLAMRPQLMQMTDASTGRSALHCACAADIPNAEAVRVLLDNGASVTDFDAEGLTAFHVALLNSGDFGNIMRYAMLDYGANPNQPCQGGCTPALLCASSDSHLEALMFLKACGGDLVSAGPDQKRMPSHRIVPPPPLTPLEKAEKCGAIALRKFLGRVGTMA